MVSNRGFFFLVLLFPRTLRSISSDLNGIYDGFCPPQESLPYLSIRKATAVRTLCTRVFIFSEEEINIFQKLGTSLVSGILNKAEQKFAVLEK